MTFGTPGSFRVRRLATRGASRAGGDRRPGSTTTTPGARLRSSARAPNATSSRVPSSSSRQSGTSSSTAPTYRHATMRDSMVEALFWICAALLVYTQLGYAVLLAALASLRRGSDPFSKDGVPPSVSLVIAAYAEEDVIAAKVANARALEYGGDVEVIVACDGSPDATAQRAREAGADVVLELPRGGKIRAQDQAVERARGEIVAFGDANALWEPDALAELVAPFADPGVGYVCGQVRFVNDAGTNQEGLYWRYEMALRALE